MSASKSPRYSELRPHPLTHRTETYVEKFRYFDLQDPGDFNRVSFRLIGSRDPSPEPIPTRRPESHGLWWHFVFLTLFILGLSFFFGTYVTFRHARPFLEDALKTCEQKLAASTTSEKACSSGFFVNLLCGMYKTVTGVFSR